MELLLEKELSSTNLTKVKTKFIKTDEVVLVYLKMSNDSESNDYELTLTAYGSSFFICSDFDNKITEEVSVDDIEDIINGFRDVVDGMNDRFSLKIKDENHTHRFSICRNDDNNENLDITITSTDAFLCITSVKNDAFSLFDRFLKSIKNFN
jgi:hypothetical protein